MVSVVNTSRSGGIHMPTLAIYGGGVHLPILTTPSTIHPILQISGEGIFPPMFVPNSGVGTQPYT
jgi:hypothetical protein